MSAMTLDHLSGGRLILGIGVSGPQVVEGWYGQDFRRPLTRTREAIEILRAIWWREGPLKLITHPLRPAIPIYLGAEGPKNVRLAFESIGTMAGLGAAPPRWTHRRSSA